MQKKMYQLVKKDEDGFKLYEQGNYYFKDDELDIAIDYFKASAILNSSYRPYRMIAKCYEKKLDYKNKFLFLKKAYEASSIQDIVAKEYAESLIEQNKLTEAKRVLEETILRNPTYKQGRVLLDKINAIEISQGLII